MSLVLDRFSLNLGQTLLKNSNEHDAPIANTVGQAEGLIQIIYFLGIQIQKSSPNPALPFFSLSMPVDLQLNVLMALIQSLNCTQ